MEMEKNIPDSPQNESGHIQMIRKGKFICHIWVNGPVFVAIVLIVFGKCISDAHAQISNDSRCLILYFKRLAVYANSEDREGRGE